MTTITINRATVEQALEALYCGEAPPNARQQAAADALRAALAEPVQESGFWGRVAARQASRIKQLETAAQQALEALEGWDNYEKWVWSESALEQAKRNTAESLASLRAALAQQAEPQTTHSTECWRWHHKCAVAKIERECKHD